MKTILIFVGLLFLGSCSTSQSAVAGATDPDVVSRASYYGGACNDRTCDYYSTIHHHAVLR